MNCQEFWNANPGLEDAAGASHEHLAQCPECAARLSNQLSIKRGLRALAGHMNRIGAPPRVETHLRAAFRAHVDAQPGALASSRTHFRPAIPVFAWSAAAALFAIAVFLSAGRQPGVRSTVPSRGAEIATSELRAEMGRETTVAAAEPTTLTAENGFIPLPNATQIGPDEEAHIVRVEVSRSAMIALGYDVQPERATESVQADVMLGNDGLARAVRFLE